MVLWDFGVLVLWYSGKILVLWCIGIVVLWYFGFMAKFIVNPEENLRQSIFTKKTLRSPRSPREAKNMVLWSFGIVVFYGILVYGRILARPGENSRSSISKKNSAISPISARGKNLVFWYFGFMEVASLRSSVYFFLK
jgi:hypothetical protein